MDKLHEEIHRKDFELYCKKNGFCIERGAKSGIYASLRTNDFWEIWLHSRANSPETPDGWVACAEQMPEYGKDVQVYCSDTKEQFVGFHIGKGDFQFAKDELGNKIVCNPTHWMPLPAPPAAPTELREGE